MKRNTGVIRSGNTPQTAGASAAHSRGHVRARSHAQARRDRFSSSRPNAQPRGTLSAVRLPVPSVQIDSRAQDGDRPVLLAGYRHKRRNEYSAADSAADAKASRFESPYSEPLNMPRMPSAPARGPLGDTPFAPLFPLPSITSSHPRNVFAGPYAMSELDRDWRVRLHGPLEATSWKSEIRESNRSTGNGLARGELYAYGHIGTN